MHLHSLVDPYALRQDGSKPLTANWDAGDYQITTGLIESENTNAALSSMIMTGGEISAGTNAETIKVAALTAMLRIGSGASDSLTRVTLAEQDNITLAAADTFYNVLLTYGDPCTIATSPV
ncbi:unnamed protein product, partial [marine sediment metagenome]